MTPRVDDPILFVAVVATILLGGIALVLWWGP